MGREKLERYALLIVSNYGEPLVGYRGAALYLPCAFTVVGLEGKGSDPPPAR